MTWATEFQIVGDGSTDIAPLFRNAFTNNPQLKQMAFPPGRYMFGSQVDLPSNMSIGGCGAATEFCPLSTFSPRTEQKNSLLSTVALSENISIAGIRFNGLEIGTPSIATTRICAIKMWRTKNCKVQHVIIEDFSGYGLWFSGDNAPAGEVWLSGLGEDIITRNLNVHVEQSNARNIMLRRLRADDGKATINTEAAFHQLNFCDNIVHEDISYSGKAGAGISIVGISGATPRNIKYDRANIQMSDGRMGISSGLAVGEPTNLRSQIEITNSVINSPLGNVANLRYIEATLRNTKLHGYNVGLALIVNSTLLAEDTEILAENKASGQSSARALHVEAGNFATVTRGALRARGFNPVSAAGNPALMDISPETIREPAL